MASIFLKWGRIGGMVFWKSFSGAFFGKIAAALFLAVCAFLGFGPDKVVAFMISDLPTWITPDIARSAFILLAIFAGVGLFLPASSRKTTSTPESSNWAIPNENRNKEERLRRKQELKQRELDLQEGNSRISLIEVMRFAEKQGWNFVDGSSQHIFEFIRELRDAGSTGEVTFWGRKKQRYDLRASNQPLTKIPFEYWAHYKVDGLSCLEISERNGYASGISGDNSTTRTQADLNTKDENLYFDIQLNNQQARLWLLNTSPPNTAPKNQNDVNKAKPWATVYSGPTPPCYVFGHEGNSYIQKCRLEIKNDRYEILHNLSVRLERMEMYQNNCLPERMLPLSSQKTDGTIDINPGMKEYFDVAWLIEDTNRTIVKFIKSYRQYSAGETAGFSKEEAQAYIESGIAELKNESIRKLILRYLDNSKPNEIPSDEDYKLVFIISGKELKTPIVTKFRLMIDPLYGDLRLENINVKE